MPAPHAAQISVRDADRLPLPSWARRPKTAQALALRAHIVLAAVVRFCLRTPNSDHQQDVACDEDAGPGWCGCEGGRSRRPPHTRGSPVNSRR